ncbi:MAG: 2OG-Fe(II) oxygenase [Myxococcota bacterium]
MSILDLDAFDRTPLSTDPCDFVVVENFVRPDLLEQVVADYPRIDAPGSFDARDLVCGPTFSKLLAELQSPELAAHFSRKFGVDLSAFDQQTGIRRFADPTDGRIHNDSRNKFVTALIYFNASWTDDGGRLRLLRGPNDIEDYVAEVEPIRGTLLAFRRSERSYHGFKPCQGERLSLQTYWVNPKRGKRGGPKNSWPVLSEIKRLFKRG